MNLFWRSPGPIVYAVAVLVLAGCVAAQEPAEAAPDPAKMRPYVSSWQRQLPAQGGDFEPQGCFYETLSQTSDGRWQHVQTVVQSDDHTVSQEVRFIDGRTLRTLDLRRSILNLPAGAEGAPLWAQVRHEGNRALGRAGLPDGREVEFERQYSGDVHDGWILGVMLAASPLADGYRGTALAAIPLQNQEYRINFVVTGQEAFTQPDGASVQAWVIDTEWVDVASGDVTPAGRDEPGGAYFIAVEPVVGRSPVLAYLNTSAHIVQGACG